jgi:hypothetical protein
MSEDDTTQAGRGLTSLHPLQGRRHPVRLRPMPAIAR